jgi:hypothetical protein
MRGDTELAAWTLPGYQKVDLSLVHRVARLQLAARRAGCSIRLREAPAPLRELLDLVGLAEVVPCSVAPLGPIDPAYSVDPICTAGPGGLVVEVGGETEGGEQVGVEKAVDPGDPVA